MILVQSVEQESAGKEDNSEEDTHDQKHGDGKIKKDDDGIKVELTVQAEEDDIETIRIDQEGAKLMQALKTETDSKKAVEKFKADGDQEAEVKSEETKEKEKDKPTLIVAEKASVQDPIPIPSPGSKTEKEPSVAGEPEVAETTDGGKEDDKPSHISKPDKLLPSESSKDNDTEDPELNKSKSSGHHPDPLVSSSHPLKPLPNIDDGIPETKSEPRLPLVPPIGSKKITTLQSSNGALKSHSATGITANVAAIKEQSKGPTEKRKERESAPSSDQMSTKKKKKSSDSLRSTSGSSISKSKKTNSSSSAVSLGQKSKSRESLKSGPQS